MFGSILSSLGGLGGGGPQGSPAPVSATSSATSGPLPFAPQGLSKGAVFGVVALVGVGLFLLLRK